MSKSERMVRWCGAASAVAAVLATAPAAAAPPDATPICDLIAEAAEIHDVPKAFLARVIWTESRFDADAVSPKGAQGVAQFIPATAKQRGLDDPFDPEQAIPAAAGLLADLRSDFGNLGLAAAAYNAGSGRVEDWLGGRRGLPLETRRYVWLITGEEAEAFRSRAGEIADKPLVLDTSFEEACRALPTMRLRSATVPTWGAEIAGGRSRAAAERAGEKARRRHAALVDGGDVAVLRSRRAGPLWSVQIAADSRSDALRLCDGLRRSGGYCVVRRN